MADLNEDLNKILNDAEDSTFRYDPEDIAKNKWVCALAYLSILFFLPLVVCPNSKYGKFHANQALALLIVAVIGNVFFAIARGILGILHLGWVIGIVSSIWGLLIFVLMILGIVNVLNSKAKELPVIGKFKLIRVE